METLPALSKLRPAQFLTSQRGRPGSIEPDPRGALRPQWINRPGLSPPRPQDAEGKLAPDGGAGPRARGSGLRTRAGGRRLAAGAARTTWMRFCCSKAVCTHPGTSPGSSSEPFPLRIDPGPTLRPSFSLTGIPAALTVSPGSPW